MRKILFVAYQDYANVSTSMAHAINCSLNGEWDAKVFSCTAHPFKYTPSPDLIFDEADDIKKKEAKAWIEDGVDVLVWAEESPSPRDYYSFHEKKKSFADAMLFGMREKVFGMAKTFIFHAGVAYRYRSKDYNKLDLQHFHGQIVSPDLWRLSADLMGIPLFGRPLDPFHARRTAKVPGAVRFCHSPTHRAHKGTDIIDAAMERVRSRRSDITYSHIGGPYHEGKHIPFGELREARANFDVYIDQFSPVGGVGMSALEAMGEGLVALCSTQMIPEEVWEICGLSSKECPLVQLSGPVLDPEVDSRYLERRIIEVANSFAPHQGELSKSWVRSKMNPHEKACAFIESLGFSIG